MSTVDEWFTDMRQRELDQFKVGDEVVVTLHGECKPYILHGEREVGKRGIILSKTATHRGEDHPLWVMFHRPLDGRTTSLCYAPGELRHFDMLNDINWTPAERAALTAAAQPSETESE